VATAYEDFHIAIPMNRVEYKKHKKNKYGVSAVKCHLIQASYFSKIASPNFSTCPEVHSCSCDRKLTTTSQQPLISGSNYDPDVAFRPLK
jgi:hypothetical protein